MDPASNIAGLDWAIVAQVHQANVHDADGAPVEAAPPFSLALQRDAGGEKLVVESPTATGAMRKPDIDPATGRRRFAAGHPMWTAEFAPGRALGSAPFAQGVWHEVEFRFRDGQGGPGLARVVLDGETIVDRPDIPTGYGYVADLGRLSYLGGPQLTGSYVKIGFYGGMSRGEPSPDSHVSLAYKDVSVTVGPAPAP
jgi:hypothetical protein